MSWIKTIIFDLDGTLLNTLEDLMDSVNHALKTKGKPERTLSEIRSFVGNGAENLIRKSLGEGITEEEVQETLQIFKVYYDANCQIKTDLYPGVREMLKTLKAEGYRMGIVSNKHQNGVKPLYEAYFEDTVEVAIGQQETMRKKPDPDAVFLAMQVLEAEHERTLYVGDSEVDYETARRAGIPCLLVTWGFRERDELKAIGGKHFAETVDDVIDFIKNVKFEAIESEAF